MQCQTCQYTLFNLTAPRCPECNTLFDVTTYSFEPGMVQFGCPHCDQLYEGNDDRGLPFPRRFECVNCRQSVDVSGMRVVPVSDDAAGLAGGALGLAWEHPEDMGLVRRWWETCKLGMRDPTRYYQQLRYVDDLGKALGFAAVSTLVSATLAMLISGLCIFGTFVRIPAPPGAGVPAELGGALMVLAVPMGIAYWFVATMVTLFVGGCVLHLGVMMFARQRRGLGSTLVVLAYAMCPAVWAAIPFLGSHVVGVWSFIVSLRGIAVVHRTTRLRAVAAYSAPGLILLMVMLFSLGLIGLALAG